MATVIASVTLAGSIISCISTAFVLISFTIYRRQLFNFRQVLVLNLAVADFINSLNNSISGIIFVKTHKLEPGTPCIVNGLVGQLSVQAADFSILAIALVVLFTVTRKAYLPSVPKLSKVAICASIWIIPLITSIVPAIMGELEPVGGNWCWIAADRSDLRYALTYGWRFFVIFCTIGIYIYVWYYLRSQFKAHHSAQNRRSDHLQTADKRGSALLRYKRQSGFQAMKDEETELSESSAARQDVMSSNESNMPQKRATAMEGGNEIERQHDIQSVGLPHVTAPYRASTILKATPSLTLAKGAELSDSKVIYLDTDTSSASNTAKDTQGNVLQTNASEFPIRHNSQQVEREIKRMMLLNGYPFMYVLLWIPGVINRLMEASGNALSTETSAALQVSTQFVGFANAITYGFNHHLRDRLKGIYLTPFLSKVRQKLRWRVCEGTHVSYDKNALT